MIPNPRFRRIGNSFWRPTDFKSSKFWMLRVPIWTIAPVGLPVFSSASAISSTWLSCVTSMAMTLIPCFPASSKTHGRHSLPWPWNA